jgi:hypothetical protein
VESLQSSPFSRGGSCAAPERFKTMPATPNPAVERTVSACHVCCSPRTCRAAARATLRRRSLSLR